MIGLVAQDAKVDQVLPVHAGERVGGVERLSRGAYYAVFRGRADSAAIADLAGLLPAQALPSNGEKAFGDLVAGEVGAPIAANLTLPEVLKRLRVSGVEVLPVADENGNFVGAISHRSVLDALLKRERDLLKKARDFRATVQDDKKRLYETVRRLEQVNQAFKKVLGTLARPAGREMFQRGIEALTATCQAEYAAVTLVDESGRSRETVVAGTAPGKDAAAKEFGEQRWALVEQTIAGNRILNIKYPKRYLLDLNKAFTSTPITSFLAMPISREGQVFGCVYLCNKQGVPFFSDEDEELVASYAAGLSLTLAQAREAAQRRRAERERDLLANTGLRLTTAVTLEQFGEVVRSATEEFWHWDSFSLSVRRSGHGVMHRIVEVDNLVESADAGDSDEMYDTPEAAAEPGRLLAPATPHGVRGMVSAELKEHLEKGECILINRKLDEPGPELDRFGDVSRPSASMLFAPMMVDGGLVGIVSVQSYREDRFKESDRDLLQRFADVVSPSLRRVQAERRSEAFSSLGYRLSMVAKPSEAAEIIVDIADQLIGWDSCSIYMFDLATDDFTNLIHMDIIDGKRSLIQLKDLVAEATGYPLRAIRNGPQLILRDEPKFNLEEADPFGDKSRPSASLMFVPLRLGSKVLGVMSIQSYTRYAYDEGDLHLLQALADHCTGALERMRVQQTHTPPK